VALAVEALDAARRAPRRAACHMVDVDDGIAARTFGRARSGVYSSLGAFTRFVAFSTADRPYPSALRCVRCVRAMSDGASLTSAWVLPCVLVRSSKWRTAPARPRRARERDRPRPKRRESKIHAVVRLFVRFDIFIQQRETRVRTSIASVARIAGGVR
jgi:hypothetical protein